MSNEALRIREAEKVEWLLAPGEEVIYAVNFFKNSMIATNKSIIYIDVAVAKKVEYSILPYKSIKALTFKEATGFSVTTGLRLMGSGDKPLMEVEVKFNDDFKKLCQIINEKIG